MPTTDDLLGQAIEKNPVDFADTLNNILMQKAHERIEQHRVELAQAIYGNDDGDDDLEASVDDVEDDDSDDDFDLDDIDLEDLDIDDLDLDDIDLEDITDEDA